MNNVKAPVSHSYQDYLISRLSDRTYAATYLETHLEEATAEPDVLHLALLNVSEALSRSHPLLQAADHQQKLDDLLSQPGSQAIQSLADWLNQLGLKLTVVAQPPTSNLSEMGSTHSINPLHSTFCHAELADLLKQLQSAIESDPDLPNKGKATALEQVKTLAEVAQNPDQTEKKSLGTQSVTFLKNAASFLPDTAKLAEACTKLLPLISKALGLE
ncbi:hypothetical protein ACKFKF_20040 [Phormidesmis sp. 146-12]